MIITEFKSVIIISTNLFDTEEFSISECYDIGLISFLVEEIMWGSFELMGFQVEN